jgi:Fur family transcriptional regulator, ferric uptake regulator
MRTGIISRMTWAEHARDVLSDAGVKPGAARTAVIDVVADQHCCLSAPAIHEEVRRRRPGVGLASVYRALQTLTELGLVHRLDLRSGGGARYEPAQPSGDHHHHLVCGDCGKVEAFSDDQLENVIHNVSEAASFRVDGHDVVLRGRCEGCA